MKVLLKKVHGGMVPVDEAGEKFIGKIKIGEMIDVDVKRPRNIKLHNKWWCLCSFLAEHSDRFPTSEHASKYLLIQLGYCTQIAAYQHISSPKHLPVLIADSIAFANMDDDTFSGMYSKACDLLCEIIPHVTDANVAQVLAEFAGVGALMNASQPA